MPNKLIVYKDYLYSFSVTFGKLWYLLCSTLRLEEHRPWQSCESKPLRASLLKKTNIYEWCKMVRFALALRKID